MQFRHGYLMGLLIKKIARFLAPNVMFIYLTDKLSFKEQIYQFLFSIKENFKKLENSLSIGKTHCIIIRIEFIHTNKN